jgi:hypothetical protein
MYYTFFFNVVCQNNGQFQVWELNIWQFIVIVEIICQSLYSQYILDQFHFFKSPKAFRVVITIILCCINSNGSQYSQQQQHKKKFSCNTQNTKHKKNDSNRQCFYVINFVVKEKIKVIINCFNYNGTTSCGELYITLESLLWVVSFPISVWLV